jgi:uncharacterized protein YqjF (DUF2071 family)
MKDNSPSIDNRLSIRNRPEGTPVMHQSWGKLLFMHWQIPVESLRQLIPEPLMIDTYDGKAWIAITPLTIWDARPTFTPPLPLISNFHELNVRTYVYLDGVPGVWFFSLDANSMVAVTGARTLFSLPYYNANISLEQEDRTIVYNLSRKDETAKFNAKWTIGDELPKAEPGSLDFFLIERYCLYTSNEEKLYRCRIHHQPWALQEANLSIYQSSMIEANGLPTPVGEPLLHCGGPVDVDVWALEEL